MKNLLNLGVSNPLTLGMAHPVADRLETLGRARPTSWKSRCLALSAMSVIAMVSAPLSIAADDPETDMQVKLITNGQSYEIVDEDGEKKAYRLLKDGDREEVELSKNSDGSYELTYEDGQTVDLPDIDMDSIAGLKNLAVLEGLEGLAALDALDGRKVVRSIKSIETLEGLGKLDILKRAGMVDGDVRVVTVHGSDSKSSDKMFEKFPEKFREMLDSKGTAKLKITHDRDGVRWVTVREENGEVVELDDTIVSGSFEFFGSSDPLESAQDQLEQTKRQLEILSANEAVSFDLQNAMRDIENAQKSLEEAENRLLNENE